MGIVTTKWLFEDKNNSSQLPIICILLKTSEKETFVTIKLSVIG